MSTPTDIRALVPRVRRAVEGAGAEVVLTDDAVKDLVADALASIILYTGSAFGKTLDVAEVDPDTHAPVEYTTSDALTLPEGTVVAAQAALDYFFFKFAGLKISETISDEGGSWDYSLSANLLVAQLKYLVSERDRALDQLGAGLALDTYVSFLSVRDASTARFIEPWVDGGGLGGQDVLTAGGVVLEPDYRFGGLG